MNNEGYAEYVKQVVVSVYGERLMRIKYLGGGFYGRVFEVKMRVKPFVVIVKLHLLNNMGELECRQIEVLRKYARVKLPEIYRFVTKTTESDYDAIIMEKISGRRVDTFKKIPEKYKQALAEQIIDNMISWHDVTNDTFGEIGGKQYAEWKEYLQAIIDNILLSLKVLQKDNPDMVVLYNEIKEINSEMDAVIPDGIKPELIHGEYNTRNIFKIKDKITGVIDPFAAGFADREFALHQLDVLNGRQLGLLALYKSKVKVSDNFEKKSAFYKLFLELRHHLAVLRLEEKHIIKIKKLVDEYKGLSNK
ncbi:MAG: phosphotransferase [Clostridiales bacterium]|jgi:fructosamine-3-kinase|nr:phosphotransferase [Clostridiales bacterium]